MDRIRLTGIEAVGYHGVFDEEKRDGQRFVVDLAMGLDLSMAARSDDLADTIDYATVGAAVVAAIEAEPLDLIEALAGRIIAAVFSLDDRLQEVEATVHKPEVPMPAAFGAVSVTLRRRREDVGGLR